MTVVEEGIPYTTDSFATADVDSFSLSGAERYTMTEAARIKGVSYHTVSRAVRRGRLPVTRLGRMALIAGEDLHNWQPMKERAPRRHRQDAVPTVLSPPILFDHVAGERLSLAQEISTVIEEVHAASWDLPLPAFGELLATRSASMLGLLRVSVWAIHPDRLHGELLATQGTRMSAAPPDTDLSSGFKKLFQVVDMGNVRVSIDPATEFGDSSQPPGTYPIGPLVIMPLRARGRTVGAICGDREGGPIDLDEEQIAMAQILCNQMALAVDHALHRRKELFRSELLSNVLDQITDQVRACDLNGRLILANFADKAFTRSNGKAPPELGSDAMANPEVASRNELDGTPIPPERHPLARALRGEEIVGWEYELVRFDGRRQRALVGARPLIIDGEIQGAVYMGRNVTLEREAEARVQRQFKHIEESRLRAQSLADTTISLNTANDTAEALQTSLVSLARQLGDRGGFGLALLADGGYQVVARYGVSPDQASGSIRDPIAVSTSILALSRMSPLVVTRDEAGEIEQQLMERAGAHRLLVLPIQSREARFGSISIFLDEDEPLGEEDRSFAAAIGRQCALACERLRLQGERDAIQARMHGVIEQFPQAVVIVDAATGLIRTANHVANALWGRKIDLNSIRADSLGLVDVGRAPDGPRYHPLVKSLHTGQRSVEERLRLERFDGTVVDVVATHAPIQDGSGKIVASVSVLQDWTQLQLFDRSKSEFVTQVINRLLKPMENVREGLARLQQSSVHQPMEDGPGQLQADLDIVNRDFEYLSGTIEDFLDVSRIDIGKLSVDPRETDASQLIQSAVASVLTDHPGHVIRVTAPQSMLVVWDEHRIGQCLLSLLDNAIQYAPDGPIDIESEVVDTGWIRVSIHDRGPGISPGLISRLGTQVYPFDETVDPRSDGNRGLGIGLYLASHLVDLHGGKLSIEREDAEGGTRVTIMLPRIALPRTQEYPAGK